MKNKKRQTLRCALSFALMLLLLMTAVPLTVSAANTEAEAYKTGDIIEFGSYPQSEVTDENVKAKLNGKAGSPDGWTSYGYYRKNEATEKSEQGDFMKYTDVELEGEKYRGVYFTAYRPLETYSSSKANVQEKNGYKVNTQYWFKFEPMQWQVLSFDKATGNAVVMSKNIIDSREYCNNFDIYKIDGKRFYSNNYERSNIRAWLNGSFYNDAFCEAEKNAIVATTLDNKSYSPKHPDCDSDTTVDNVWLLSFVDVHNSDYGFEAETKPWSNSATRTARGTAYAFCQGLLTMDNGNSYWRLRTAGMEDYKVSIVNFNGALNVISLVSFTQFGVRPAVTVHLSDGVPPVCEHDYSATVTPPRCEERGFTTYTCVKCSESYVADYTDSLGHDWSEWIVTTPATVDRDGCKISECENCHCVKALLIEKLTVITINKDSTDIKDLDGFVAAVPDIGADKIIAATGGSTKIYKDGKEVVGAESEKPATGMQLVLASGDGTIVASRDIVIMGDLNGDGEISVGDARLALRAAVGLDVISGAVHAAACISHGLDAAVAVSDARLILRAAVSLDNPSDWMKNK